MDKATLLVIRFLALALLLPLPALAQRAQAELACAPTKTDFIYDCTIRLTRGGQPLSGAQITVGADMPSMPMAHNVKPVKAKPGRASGEYAASLDLEMLGEWAVKLRLAGPVKDQLVLLYDFDDKGARPVTRSGKPHRK
ncbi:MAG: FixH family protein [Betaproteobacteria bacterium]